jgi:hypothetical protein
MYAPTSRHVLSPPCVCAHFLEFSLVPWFPSKVRVFTLRHKREWVKVGESFTEKALLALQQARPPKELDDVTQRDFALASAMVYVMLALADATHTDGTFRVSRERVKE